MIAQLNSLAQSEKKDDYQKDTYYVPQHRNFLDEKPISEWLRLRESKEGYSLNYKHWHNKDGENTTSCDEFQTSISDICTLEKILESLNFRKIIIVEKIRNTWQYKDVEIAIDNVTNLGYYIELEAKGNFKTIDEAKNHLYSVLGELNAKVGEQDFKGYPYRILEQKNISK